VTNIDPREAAQALDDIEHIVQRVRKSRTYDIASQMMILWGVLVIAGNLLTFAWPRYGGYIWIGVNTLGALGSIAISMFRFPGAGGRGFDLRMAMAFCFPSHLVCYAALCSVISGHARWAPSGRSISCSSTVWPAYGSVAPLLPSGSVSPS
jgi:hypothetical protein